MTSCCRREERRPGTEGTEVLRRRSPHLWRRRLLSRRSPAGTMRAEEAPALLMTSAVTASEREGVSRCVGGDRIVAVAPRYDRADVNSP
jgi:hypothetical protein